MTLHEWPNLGKQEECLKTSMKEFHVPSVISVDTEMENCRKLARGTFSGVLAMISFGADHQYRLSDVQTQENTRNQLSTTVIGPAAISQLNSTLIMISHMLESVSRDTLRNKGNIAKNILMETATSVTLHGLDAVQRVLLGRLHRLVNR